MSFVTNLVVINGYITLTKKKINIIYFKNLTIGLLVIYILNPLYLQ